MPRHGGPISFALLLRSHIISDDAIEAAMQKSPLARGRSGRRRCRLSAIYAMPCSASADGDFGDEFRRARVRPS